jgi:hypothetical protein
MIIMPKDCYKATSGPHKGHVVRKSAMGVEIPAAYSEVRYITSDFEKEAVEQAFRFHTCDCAITSSPGELPVTFSWIPKSSQAYKIEEYS